MKIKKAARAGKSGGVLLMVMLVMLAFSFLSVGLFHMSATNAVEAVYQDHSSQAFWVAESGILDAIQRLRFNSNFRNLAAAGSESFTVSNAVDGTRYDVEVTYVGGSPFIEHFDFEVESTGWKNGMNRRIRQDVTTRPGFISAIMSPNDIHIAQNTLVSGPIAVLDGATLKLDDKIPSGQNEEGDFDIIILDDGSSVDKKSGANEGEHYALADLPVPDMPTMPTGFGDLVTAAGGSTNPAPPAVFNPGGTTHYYDIPTGITFTDITGGGTIVNTGPIIIAPDSDTTDTDVAANVKLVSGAMVDIGKMNNFAGDTLVYAETYVVYGDHSFMTQKSVILANGHDGSAELVGINMGGHSQFEGILYAANGSINVQQGSNGSETRITGTMISGEGVELGQNSEVFFDPGVFNDDLFDLTQFFKTQAIAYKGDWEELAPQ